MNVWSEFVLLYILVSPCAATPCQNDGTCSVDANGEATCACKGEWSGFYCSGMYKFIGKNVFSFPELGCSFVYSKVNFIELRMDKCE